MTDNRIADWVNDQINLQKQSAMRFTGRHDVLVPGSHATRDIVDFDFHAEMAGFADLEMIQIRRLHVAEKAFVTTAEDGKTDENELVKQAINQMESIMALGHGRITFDNVFVNYDGMLTNLQACANRAYYGGRVEFGNENASGAIESEDPVAADSPQISIQAVWRYKWDKPEARSSLRRVCQSPSDINTGPRPVSWHWRIQHAMVDGEQGVISLHDEISGTAPMVKAIAKYALREPLTKQGNFGTCKIHKWGLHEPNDERPYVGTTRFGESVRELPPPYSE
ncbi:unnamed protein product [Aureobasidium mustum]|uniref:Uncharacterized protein n=1 Tax=Aureobasidium mustum TaxID=2773714 RepID=A0A9N8JYR7_9PEZI|nr:unnamed protein product [Aureobasidium mustum]